MALPPPTQWNALACCTACMPRMRDAVSPPRPLWRRPALAGAAEGCRHSRGRRGSGACRALVSVRACRARQPLCHTPNTPAALRCLPSPLGGMITPPLASRTLWGRHIAGRGGGQRGGWLQRIVLHARTGHGLWGAYRMHTHRTRFGMSALAHAWASVCRITHPCHGTTYWLLAGAVSPPPMPPRCRLRAPTPPHQVRKALSGLPGESVDAIIEQVSAARCGTV